MKLIIVFAALFIYNNVAYSQTPDSVYNAGVEKVYAGEYQESIQLLSQSIDLNPDQYKAWHFRAYSKTMLKMYNESILDYDKAIELNDTVSSLFSNRGISKLNLEMYDDALRDFNHAINLDSTFAVAYHFRGLVYLGINKPVLACTDFNASFLMGNITSREKVDDCNTRVKKEADEYYLKGNDLFKKNDFENAIINYSACILLQPSNYYAWINRGLCQDNLSEYDKAYYDLNMVVKLAPNNKKAFLLRGTAFKHLTMYTEAINDYTQAIKLDSLYSEAYFNRGLVYELLRNTESSCADFSFAQKLRLESADRKIQNCNDSSRSDINPIPFLVEIGDETYGYTRENPVKVGCGPNGGPANQRAYLNLLRDELGKPISYVRKGSCCHYKTENDPLGLGIGLLDIYEITFMNKKGKEKKTTIYVSYYDYEEPKIISGFSTIRKINIR